MAWSSASDSGIGIGGIRFNSSEAEADKLSTVFGEREQYTKKAMFITISAMKTTPAFAVDPLLESAGTTEADD
jgi:hypothetical protein